MKKLLITIAIVALAVLLAACGAKDGKDTADQPSLPPPPPPAADTGAEDQAGAATGAGEGETVAPATDDATIVKDETGLFGDDFRDQAVAIDNIKCTSADKKLTFTLKNTDVKDWQMDQDIPFPPPVDIVPLKIFVNNFEANGHQDYYDPDTKEKMFGPNEKFSLNCGGVEILKVGEIASCTLQPVKLVSEADYQNTNRLFIDTPGIEEVFNFQCV